MKKERNKEYEPLFVPVKEVCKLLGVKSHIIDYWIKRIPEIKPVKVGKRKFFKRDHIELLLQIKKLLEEGYTLEGIRKKLFSYVTLFPELELPSKKKEEKILPFKKTLKEEDLRGMLKEILKELKNIYELLNK
ncbi:MAG: MerR family transcriptional regulator [Caldimicrobium sp.]